MSEDRVRIAPSLLSADFADLRGEISKVEGVGVDLLHLDVMDGHFVDNITFGPMIVEAVRRLSSSDLDVHLMIEEPQVYLERFIESGATYVTFHVETVGEAMSLVERTKSMGVKAGVAVNPETPVSCLEPVYEAADLIVTMTVNPGFAGQSFVHEVVRKIRALYDLKQAKGYTFEIEVDGGVNVQTAPLVAWAGADILVAGAAIFNTGDPADAIKGIARAAAQGLQKRHDPGSFPLAPS